MPRRLSVLVYSQGMTEKLVSSANVKSWYAARDAIEAAKKAEIENYKKIVGKITLAQFFTLSLVEINEFIQFGTVGGIRYRLEPS